MTAAPGEPALGPVRVVAVCQGHRCRALLAGHQPDGMSVLRTAAGRSDRGALVSAGCPGLCAQGPIATVGAGAVRAGVLHLPERVVLGPVDAGAVAALGEVLRGSGPVVLPALLDELVLPTATFASGRS